MSELMQALEKILQDSPQKIVFSIPCVKSQEYQKAVLLRLEKGWLLEKFTKTQAFHQNIKPEQLPQTVEFLLEKEFTSLHAFSPVAEWGLKISKKGRVLTNRKLNKKNNNNLENIENNMFIQPTQNRNKKALLPEGTPIGPLVDMGIFTSSGKVAAQMYDKYRQVNRFVELVDDSVRKLNPKKLRVVDFGCGKSTLTFVLYHYLRDILGIEVEMTGIDLKEQVVANCNAAAQKYGYDTLHFEVGDISVYQSNQPVDMVVALHACDTATDMALAHAVEWGAKMIFSVPCCQHELNGQITTDEYAILTKHGIVKERIAALMTDSIRANLLDACGYKTQILEFVELSHTPKNLLLRAIQSNTPKAKKQQAYQQAMQLVEGFHLDPALLRLLRQNGRLPQK